MLFKDRYEAGKLVAEKLMKYKGDKDAIILAIPRGALENGLEMAERLDLPLGIVVTKKIPSPGDDELAIGAVDPDGSYMLNGLASEVPEKYIKEQVRILTLKIREKYGKLGAGVPALNGRVVIITDDGIAMGSTMLAAIRYVKRHHPKRIVVAVPVSAPDAAEKIRKEADEFVCLDTPEGFNAVGESYSHFSQVEDVEAKALLKRAQHSA